MSGPVFSEPALPPNGAAALGAGRPAVPEAAGARASVSPSDALRAEARRHPDSWIYEIDPAFHGPGAAPVERIVRAWRTDAGGAILADTFVDNPYYRPAEATPARASRPRRAAVLLAMTAAVVAVAVAAFLILNHGSGKHAPPPSASVPALTTTTPPVTATAPAALTATSPATTSTASTPSTAAAPATAPSRHKAARPARHAAPPVVRLSVVATGRVWVCVVDATGRRPINGVVLLPGQTSPVLVSREFKVFTGNNAAELRVGGVAHAVATGAHPAYLVTPGGVTPLSSAMAEPCP